MGTFLSTLERQRESRVFASWRTWVLLGLSLTAALAGQYTAAAVLFVGFVAVSAWLKSEALRTQASQSIGVSENKTESASAGVSVTGASDLQESANSEDGDADLDEFAFDSDHKIQLERGQKRYRSCSHTPDYDVIWEHVCEYRIEGTKVFHRVLESKDDRYGEVEYSVRDNVVLEHEIRQRNPEEPMLAGCGVEEILESTRASVEWSEVHGRLKYFILSRHAEALPTPECRRYFRQELQRLECGFAGVVKKAAEFGAALTDQELCKFNLPQEIFEDSVRNIFSEESLKSCNISLVEFTNGKNLITTLKRFLGEG